MTLRTQLEQAIAKAPGCIAAGYIDLEMGLPLAVVTDPPLDEEFRDVFAAGAVQALASASAGELAGLMAPEVAGQPTFMETVVMGDDSFFVYERPADRPAECLCLVFAIEADPAKALQAARAAAGTVVIEELL